MKFTLVENFDVMHDVTDAHHNQIDGHFYVPYGPDKYEEHPRLLADLSYSLYDDEVHINMIQVRPEFRRKGMATAMFKALQKEYSDKKINLGYSTPDGTAFNQSLGL